MECTHPDSPNREPGTPERIPAWRGCLLMARTIIDRAAELAKPTPDPEEFLRVQEVGRSPLTVPTGTPPDEALEKVDELVQARKMFRNVMDRLTRERNETEEQA